MIKSFIIMLCCNTIPSTFHTFAHRSHSHTHTFAHHNIMLWTKQPAPAAATPTKRCGKEERGSSQRHFYPCPRSLHKWIAFCFHSFSPRLVVKIINLPFYFCCCHFACSRHCYDGRLRFTLRPVSFLLNIELHIPVIFLSFFFPAFELICSFAVFMFMKEPKVSSYILSLIWECALLTALPDTGHLEPAHSAAQQHICWNLWLK